MKEILVVQVTPKELREMIYETVKQAIIELKDDLLTEKSEVLLTRKEAAELLKISLPTLHDWSKEGKLESYKKSGRVYYKRNELLNNFES